jgi:hypothetical protein
MVEPGESAAIVNSIVPPAERAHEPIQRLAEIELPPTIQGLTARRMTGSTKGRIVIGSAIRFSACRRSWFSS